MKKIVWVLVPLLLLSFITLFAAEQNQRLTPAELQKLTSDLPAEKAQEVQAELENGWTPSPARQLGGALLSKGALSEGFEGSFPPDGWTVIDQDGGGHTWEQYSSYPHSGSYSAACRWESYSLQNDDWLITPQLSVSSGDNISFWYRAYSSYYTEDVEIRVSTTGTNPSDFTDLLTTISTNNTTYQQANVSLTSYAGQNIYVAFRYVSLNQFRIIIDDVTGPQIVTAANDMAAISIDNPADGALLEGNTTVSIQATVKNLGSNTQSGVPVKLKITGTGGYEYTDQENTGTLNPDDTEQITFSPDWTVPNTIGSYTIKVWTELSGDEVPDNDTISIAVSTYKAGSLMESFTGTTFPPEGWTRVQTSTYYYWKRSSSTYHTAPGGAYVIWDWDQDEWLITPKLDVGSGDNLSFWYKFYASGGTQTFKVMVSTTGTDPSDFTDVVFIGDNSVTDWTNVGVDLSAYASKGEIYIAFVYQTPSSGTTKSIYLDDIIGPPIWVPAMDVATTEIISPPRSVQVGVPVTPQAKVENKGGTSADFWVKCTIDGYSDSSYVSGLSPYSSTTVSFSDWTPSSGGDYTVTVWTELSGDADPANDTLSTVVTACAAYSVPFMENFDGDWGPNGDNPPACWTIIDNGDESPPVWNHNDWYRSSAKTQVLTGEWAEYEKLALKYRTKEDLKQAVEDGVISPEAAEKVSAIGRSYFLRSGKDGYLARVTFIPVENQDEWLITPVLDCPDTTILLSFWMNYQDYSIHETDTGFVYLSTDGGVTWPYLVAMYAGEDITGEMAYDITSIASGQSQVKLAFRYKGHDDLYWEVDDVQIFYPWYHDVGTVSIDSPVPLIFTNLYPVGEEMHIKATVQNYGHFTETFDAICYLNSEEVSFRVENLAPGEQRQITFNFTPTTEETWTVTVHTALAGDMDGSNDDQTQSDLFVTQVPKSYPYFADFEAKGAEGWEVGGWYGPPYDFEVGTPTYGPPGAYSGSNVWATVLDDDYNTDRAEVLISPLIDLRTADPEKITYTFWHWFNMENTYDGGLAFITWPDSTTMYFIEPEGGYPGYFYFGYSLFPGWTGSSPSYPDAYDGVSIIRSGGSYYDFSQAAGHIVRVGFLFSSDYSYTYEGWYLDYFDIYEPIPPTITVPADTAIDEGQTLTFTVSATDPNYHDSITLTAEDLPAGASFTQTKPASASGTFEWTPNYGQAGTYTVRFIATDLDNLADTDYVEITVYDVDQPPTITATYTTYSINLCEEECIPTDTITAFDPDTLDGDDVILTVSGLPEGATFTLAKSNPAIGYLDWCPTTAQAGSTYVITFAAQGVHSKDLYDTLMVAITVGAPLVRLGEVPMVWPGGDFCIPVIVSSPGEIGGFDFLIHFDPSVLTVTGVNQKYYWVDSDSFLLEYFNWSSWQVDDGQKLRILGIANKPNNQYTPPIPAGENELMEICFHVNAKWDPNYWIPIDFEIDNACVDNTLTDEFGENLYLAKMVRTWMFTPGEGWAMKELREGEDWDYCLTTYCDQAGDTVYGCAGYTGTVVKAPHIYGPYGDVNADGIAYTIADAVYFMEYLKGVVDSLPRPDYQGTASDVNLDGHQWTVADLIYLVNIINGTAEKPGGAKAGATAVDLVVRDGVVSVDRPVAGLYLIVKGGGEPELRASGMEMETGLVGDERRILIIGADWENETAVVSGELVRIPGEFEVQEVQVSDVGGNLMATKLELIPTQFALHQNYPNPFNPETKISFDLPQDVEVSLTIYNISGQKVAELVKGQLKAGHHTVSWDGAGVSSGVYFYRLSAGSFTATRKMVLMK